MPEQNGVISTHSNFNLSYFDPPIKIEDTNLTIVKDKFR